MSGFTACGASALSVPPDPGKRVNFMHGLVLGAGELSQESAYLANRAEWLARDLLGYGTVAGLRVGRDTRSGGAAIVVGAGVALSPRGRPIRVTMPQAVALNEWLDARANELVYRLVPGSDSPPGDLLKLFVVLCYQQCATDNQPGPGAPCRTDEAPDVYTRIADSFRVELRFDAPDQREDQSVRAFAAWLRQVEIVDDDGGTATLDGFLGALRASALLGSPPDIALSSPPEPIRVRAADAAEFLRAALGVWTTELKPMWQTVAPDDDCVLLAEVDLPIVTAADGRWMVDDAAKIAVHEERRPYLVTLRMLQELGLFGLPTLAPQTIVVSPAPVPTPDPTPPPEPAPAPTLPFSVVAAGIIVGDTSDTNHREPRFNNLSVFDVENGALFITFDGYEEPKPKGEFQYIVKALSAARIDASTPAVISLGGFDSKGIRLNLAGGDGRAISAGELARLEVTVEITRYPSEKRS